MPQCQLNLLGGWSLIVQGGSELPLPTRKDRQLLAYLAIHHGRFLLRERLANLLWSDRADAQARDSLRQSLAALRKAFRSVGLDPVQGHRLVVRGRRPGGDLLRQRRNDVGDAVGQLDEDRVG